MNTLTDVIVIGGPTASGKSGLALAIAEAFGGTVINADSMQLYADLDVLTARPPAEDLARAPHRLYGVLPAAERGSAARWRDMALVEIAAARADGRLPVVVGGTGLYLRTLMHGISPAPPIPDDIRAGARALLAEMGNSAFHAQLAKRDPVMGARLDPANSQRLARAWEVLEASGQSLAHWQSLPMEGAVPARWLTLSLDPPRNILYANCDQRFEAMMAQGALDEVRALLDLRLDPALPAMKALGVPELAQLASGRMTEIQAVEAAQRATRNYAKRQLTWFRHQLEKPEVVSAQLSERIFDEIFAKVRHFLLTPP